MRLAHSVFLLLFAIASPARATKQTSVPRLSGPDGSLAIFCVVDGSPDLGCCEANTTFVPGDTGEIEISVQVQLAGATAGGISGAEFYIDGLEDLPGNWTCTVTPQPTAWYVGDFCQPSDSDGDGSFDARRGNLAFPVTGPFPADGCQIGDNGLVPIATIRLANVNAPQVDLPVTAAQIVAGDPPSNPGFDCPLVTLCDVPLFTAVCVTGGVFIINNAIRAPNNPSPPDNATGINPVGLELGWDNPGFISCVLGTETRNVYFGTEPAPPLVSANHSGAMFDPGPLQPLETYYWRVTRSYPGHFESSPIWSFTTGLVLGLERSTWSNVKSLFR